VIYANRLAGHPLLGREHDAAIVHRAHACAERRVVIQPRVTIFVPLTTRRSPKLLR
jgi:hypothetical protein